MLVIIFFHPPSFVCSFATGEMGDVKTKMEDLKTKLYSKFGTAINLEE